MAMVVSKKASSLSAEYCKVRNSTESQDEKNDCAIIALSILTGLPYEEVLQKSYDRGREKKDGTCHHIIEKMLQDFGYFVKRMPKSAIKDKIISKYPGVHKTLKNATTHHPARFSSAWKEIDKALLFTNEHVSAMVDGKVHDWASKRSLRVNEIWEVFEYKTKGE